MPIIRVEMFPDRTVDQKRNLARELVDRFAGPVVASAIGYT